MVQLDPLGTVVAEIRVRESFEEEGVLVFVFGDRAVKALAKWESSPQLLEDKQAKITEPVECEPQQVESRLYCHSDFGRSKDGTMNIRESWFVSCSRDAYPFARGHVPFQKGLRRCKRHHVERGRVPG